MPSEIILSIKIRLIARFERGLIADIQPPDLETRIAILQKEAQMGQVDIPDDVIFYIANIISLNIRQLEKAINKLNAYAVLTQKNIDLVLAKDILKEFIPIRGKKV